MTEEVANTEDVADTGWSDAEKWAWAQIAAGAVADFAAEHGIDDPGRRGPWDAARTLGAGFLRAILFERRWIERVPAEGVRIAGARWDQPIDLAHANLKWPLCLERCRFERAVDLTGMHIDARLVLQGSIFLGAGAAHSLILTRATGRRVDLSGATFAKALMAADATFAGTFDLTGATLRGRLEFRKGKAAGLVLRDGRTGRILLSGCRIEQDAVLTGLDSHGALQMSDVRVDGHLQLGSSETRPSRFRGNIDLVDSVVGGSATFCGIDARGAINMNSLEVKKNLYLRSYFPGDDEMARGRSRFADTVDLSFAVIHGHVELQGARFHGALNMAVAQIGGNLHGFAVRRHQTAYRGGFSLAGAWVKGAVDLALADFGGSAELGGVRIDGNLYLDGCLFRKTLRLPDARLGRNVFMNDTKGSRTICRGELRLQNATIDGQFEFGGICHGALAAWGLKVGNNLLISGQWRRWRLIKPVINGSANLGFATVGGTLDLTGAVFKAGLSLTGSRTVGQLILDVRPDPAGDQPRERGLARILETIIARIRQAIWPGLGDAKAVWFDLRDAKAGSLQVYGPEIEAAGWPGKGAVQLDGFVYDRLGGTEPDETQEMMGRSAKWLRKWVRLDAPYSPQPYEQLASVLRQAGHVEKANRILHAGRESARRAAWSWRRPFTKKLGFFRWLGLFALKVTIGYGIGLRFFYALIWALVLTGIGNLILLIHPPLPASEVQLNDWPDRLAYSFDQLLPIIELNKSFSDVTLPHAAAQYFYLHRLLGFLLGAFITAGVAGLTQRSRS